MLAIVTSIPAPWKSTSCFDSWSNTGAVSPAKRYTAGFFSKSSLLIQLSSKHHRYLAVWSPSYIFKPNAEAFQQALRLPWQLARPWMFQDAARRLRLFGAAEQPAFKPWLSGLVEAFSTEASCASSFFFPISNNSSKMRNLNWGSTIYLDACELPSWRSALLLPVVLQEKQLQLGRRPPAQDKPASLVWLRHLGGVWENHGHFPPKHHSYGLQEQGERTLKHSALHEAVLNKEEHGKMTFCYSTDLLSSIKY